MLTITQFNALKHFLCALEAPHVFFSSLSAIFFFCDQAILFQGGSLSVLIDFQSPTTPVIS
jgi:hypothetical protein